MDKKPDRRIQRTQQLLRDALIALILEKGYEAVTVQDITDRANLGRATFYLHFKDKDELLLSMIEEIQQEVVERAEPLSGNNFLVDGKPPSLFAFQHAEKHAEFYRAILGEGGLAGVLTRYKQWAAAQVQAQLEPLFPVGASPIPLEIYSHFVMGALNSLTIWWLENDRPYPAEHMAQVFHQLLLTGFMGAQEKATMPQDRGEPREARSG